MAEFGTGFPDPASAPADGPLAMGGDLSPERLLAAYRSGIFPWYEEGVPILWWSPDPRFVLYPGEFKVSRSLRREVQSGRWSVSLDSDFRGVIESCASVLRGGQAGTWITGEMIEAYEELHRLGYAHSVEVRDASGALAGGLYGICIGRVFFGESMFHRQPNASKVAFVHLLSVLKSAGCELIDCQQPTAHLARFGARAIPRDLFLRHLADFTIAL